MIAEIARTVGCLAAGEVLARFLPIALPAPIVGLMLLFGFLLWRGGVPHALGTLADQMLGLFGLFFVPAGVGVVAYGETLQTDYLAIVLAVTAGTLVTIVASAAAAGALAAMTARHKLSSTQGVAPCRESDKAIISPS